MTQPASTSGIDLLNGYLNGTIDSPPAWALINCHLEWVTPGKCVMILNPTSTHLNYLGSVHGGLLAAAADAALGCVAISLLPADSPPMSTVELGVHYFRPAQPDTKIVLKAETVKSGPRMTFAKCTAFQNDLEIATFRAVLSHA